MLCEECHQNEAVYTISVMMGEAMTQRHLCADCMAKMNMNIASGNMQKLLGAILNAINRGEQPEEGEKVPDDQPDITCPRCRMTLSKFIKTGRHGLVVEVACQQNAVHGPGVQQGEDLL